MENTIIPPQFYHFENEFTEKNYKKDLADKDKYIVVCVAKNEEKYIIEWVNHYLNYGFDKIMIGDNNDDDSLSTLLSNYINNGQVELFDCHGFKKFQYQFYSMFSTVGNYQWALYVDCDEFLEITGFDNIKDYIATKDDYCQCISINWMCYGSNHQAFYRDEPVQERFPMPLTPITYRSDNGFTKTLLRGDALCGFSNPHTPDFNSPETTLVGGYYSKVCSGTVFPPRYKEIYVKHYLCKSAEEVQWKIKRGWPDGCGDGPSILSLVRFSISPKYDIEDATTGCMISGFINNEGKVDSPYMVFKFDETVDHFQSHHYDNMLNHFKNSKDTIFVIDDRNVEINDGLYNTLLEYALINNNKLLCMKNFPHLESILYEEGYNQLIFNRFL